MKLNLGQCTWKAMAPNKRMWMSRSFASAMILSASVLISSDRFAESGSVDITESTLAAQQQHDYDISTFALENTFDSPYLEGNL